MYVKGGFLLNKRHIETKLVQLGNRSDQKTGAINPPIYLSTAYEHEGLGQSTGYDYTRTKNPTRLILEDGIAELENGDQGFACSSGMAAIQLVLSLFQTGDHLIVPHDIYGGTYRLLEHYQKTYQVDTTYANFQEKEKVEEAITPNTKALFIETPTNPLLEEIDLRTYATIAKKHNLLLIVDNTFYTPYFQQPLKHGATIVIHSATKYLGGHNDVLAGLVVVKGKAISDKLTTVHNGAGSVLDPFSAWLVIRGLKTLSIRMRQHETNAKAITQFLRQDERIEQVFYPGRGGMLSFRLKKGGWVNDFLANLKLIAFAESLGGVESFITYPATQTHADIPKNERIKRGIDEQLLRFSVGIEDVSDLIEDLSQSLQKLKYL